MDHRRDRPELTTLAFGSTSAQLRPPTTLVAVLVAAVTYLVLGIAGLGFATGPGYASPIFPAAGFAVAVMLWSGGRAWVGILVASLLVNTEVAWQHGDLSLRSVLVACAISLGTTLQAVTARAVVERLIGDGWRMLEAERDVFLCLGLAGPVASLVSATVGNSVLYLSGIVPLQGFAYGWWNWWSGDTLGVLVVLPLSLAILQRKHPLWRGRTNTLVIPMVLALVVIAGVFHAVALRDADEEGATIQRHAETLARALDQRLRAHQDSLAALGRLIEVTPDMSAEQFEYYTRITLRENPDILALSSDAYIVQRDRAAFERRLAAKHHPSGYAIVERSAAGELVRAPDRDAYVPVMFIEPHESHRAALGLDDASDELRRDAFERARVSGAVAVTAPLQFARTGDSGPGVLLVQPVLSRGEGVDAAHRPALAGFATAALNVDALIDLATRASRIKGLVYQVADAGMPPDGPWLYRSESGPVTPHASGYRWQQEISFADRLWTLSVRPSAEYLLEERHWTALGVGLGGLTLAALLQMLLLVSTGRTSIFERRVAEQNAELRHQTEALEDRNAQLGAVFGLSPDGFVVFAADGRIRFVNPAFLAMSGLVTEQVLGAEAAELLAMLAVRGQRTDGVAGVADYIRGVATGAATAPLVLALPRFAVIRVVGIIARAPSVGRILYFRDVTREAEVDRIKSEFLSHAAHELRTPLTIILGYSELLLSADRDETIRRELLDGIHRQSEALVGIVNELLDLARIEARKGQDVNLESVDLASLVRATVADVAVPDARWRVLVHEPLPASRVTADPVKLGQALMNVLSNAVKYSTEGGDVEVSVVAGGHLIGIVVRDHGIGMTPEQVSHYGERFWRADQSGLIAGTGLGVSIVKEILALMRGELDIQSSPGQGTTVTLWLTPAGS